MTDAEGLTTTYTYDALGRTICETRPGFRGALLITSNEYNTANQLVATRTYVLNENSTPTPVAGMRCCRDEVDYLPEDRVYCLRCFRWCFA